MKDYCGKTFMTKQVNAFKNANKTFQRGLKTLKNKVPSLLKPLKGLQNMKLPKELLKKLSTMKLSKKERDDMRKKCIRSYCNPGCKGTLFQKGRKMPAEVYKMYKGKGSKLFKKMINSSRKNIFGKSDNVLKNDFYKDMSARDVGRMRKQGALSGCSIMPLT